jgi:hypothetical protein
VVVFLQELQIEALADLAVQNLKDLGEALLGGWLLGSIRLGLDDFLDLRLIGLVLFLTDVEGDLVGMQVRVTFVINQIFEQGGGAFRDLEEELAECDVVGVEVAVLAPVLVNDEKQPQHLGAELLRDDDLLSNSEAVGQVGLHLGTR